jgi:hypothetical protein
MAEHNINPIPLLGTVRIARISSRHGIVSSHTWNLSLVPQILKNSPGAYLAMLEQTIYLKMVEIAERYPEPYRRQYLEATASFGLPYCECTILAIANGVH